MRAQLRPRNLLERCFGAKFVKCLVVYVISEQFVLNLALEKSYRPAKLIA